MSLPDSVGCTPPPTMLLAPELRAEAHRLSSSSFYTLQGAVRNEPHPATFGPSQPLLSASPPTPLNPRIIADREGAPSGCLASIMVKQASLRDAPGLWCPPHNLQTRNGFLLSSCRQGIEGRRKIQTAELHKPCPDDVWVPGTVPQPQLRIY